MTISPSLAGLPILTPTTGDELVVHALVHAVMPSEQRATCRTITPSPLKISTPQIRQKYAPGSSCDEQPTAQPSRDVTTMSATIARGPPLHNCGNDKALEEKPELRSCLSIFGVRDSQQPSYSERTTAMSDYSIPIPPHNTSRQGTPLDEVSGTRFQVYRSSCRIPACRRASGGLEARTTRSPNCKEGLNQVLEIKEKNSIVWHACVSPAPRFLVRHTLRGMAAGAFHE